MRLLWTKMKEAGLFIKDFFLPLLVEVCEALDDVGIRIGEVFGFGNILSYIT